MSTWIATAKALIAGAFNHPKKTTVVVKNRRTGKVTGRKVDDKPHSGSHRAPVA